MTIDLLSTVTSATLYSAAPLIFAAVGGIFSERSGVIQIGLEGFMVFGAFSGIVTTLLLEEQLGVVTPWFALLLSAIVCGLFSLLHATAAITFKADQVVTGVAVNMIALGLSLFLVKQIFSGKGQTDFISYRLNKIDVPFLSDIPVIGPLFFTSVPWTSYLAVFLAFFVWIVMTRTIFGLRLRAVGEHPGAADTVGINVVRMRYMGVILSGVFAGVGGAVFALSISGNFSTITIAGQGFLALAAMIFGKWHPLGTLLAALFFGFAQALSISGPYIPFIQDLPSVVLTILPYILTLVALTGFSRRSAAPGALGQAYDKESR